MTLKQYQKKRNFKLTPEPSGKKTRSRSKLLYVIQKHAASHLHYDLRLELDGVLKSWAVPKGPCLDPTVKRLAVHVEDHPIDYGSFEGTIPKGQYGGGTVMLWDKGTWIPEETNPTSAYKAGHLKFILKGKKLKGQWKLVQIKSDPKNWLLIKATDQYARSLKTLDITKAEPLSVTTKKTLDEIAFGKKKLKNSKIKVNPRSLGKKSPFPESISPQLATLSESPPTGNEWVHELKFDGYRLICFVQKNKIKLLTRNHQDWTHKFPTIVKAIKQKKLSNVILDGEVVALDEHQHSNFQLLQNSLNNQVHVPLIYYLFDIIYYAGYDLQNVPLIKRKELLHQLIPSTDAPVLRYSDYVTGNGEPIFKKACDLGLEGIVSKESDSPYLQKRTQSWLKVKCIKRQEFIICGYTQPQGQRQHFGSLLLGVYNAKKNLVYCGHVGTGFTEQSLNYLVKLLQRYKTTKMPFVKKPPVVEKVTWVKPTLIAEVEFSEWTQEGILRHPSFKGLRTDKLPREVNMEKSDEKLVFPLSHPGKILYPEAGITKGDLAEFYTSIQDWILPYLIKRPLTLVRCPNGWNQECFFQKHHHGKIDASLSVIDVVEKHKKENYVYLKSIDGLLSLVQLGTLEIHTWNCHIDNIEKPDVIIFDLDPAPNVEWKKVIAAAHFIKQQLENIQLQSFVKTTGGKGLHVVVPIKRQRGWADIKLFCHAFVDTIVALKPNEYTGSLSKAKRSGKIFIDYLRNQKGATSIAPYSTRAREYAPVATPLSWSELTTRIKPLSFTIKTVPQRLAKLTVDPWEEFYELKQVITFPAK